MILFRENFGGARVKLRILYLDIFRLFKVNPLSNTVLTKSLKWHAVSTVLQPFLNDIFFYLSLALNNVAQFDLPNLIHENL